MSIAPPSSSPLFSDLKETGRQRRFALESLEPRWLLSATPVAAALQAAWPAPADDTQLLDVAQPVQSASSTDQLDLSQDAQVPGTWVESAGAAEDSATALVLAGQSDVLQGRLTQVYGQARSVVQAFLSAHTGEELQALFPGSADQPAGLDAVQAVRQDWLQGAGGVTLTLASNTQMGGAMAAFTVQGPSGGPEVFVNRQWLAGLASDTDLLRALVEELGHGLDAAINGEHDSPGDEGELFAANVLSLPLEPAQRQRIALEDDHAVLWWGLSSYAVEQAANYTTSQDISSGWLQDDVTTISGLVTLTSTHTDVNNPGANGMFIVGTSSTTGDPASFLNGDSSAATPSDQLTVRATGVVRFYSAIGLTDPLEGLTVTSPLATPGDYPSSVIFQQDVYLSGPLLIETDGNVVFMGKLTLTGPNASLTIRGASLIEFNKAVNVAGDILLEGDEINLVGNAATLKSSGGVLTLRSTTVGLGMEVGSPNAVDLNKLEISAAELANIAEGGFSKIILGLVDGSGHAAAGQGVVRIAGVQDSASQYTFRAPLEVYGASIRIEDIASPVKPGLAIKGSLLLDATGNIDIRNRVLASTDLSDANALQNITLYSATGQVVQTNESADGLGDGLSSEPLQGAALTVRALTGINLLATEVNTASLTNDGSGNIRLIETANGGVLTLLKAQLSSSANTSGIVSVQTLATDGDLTLTLTHLGDVSAPGSLSLRAGGSLTLGANADLVRPGAVALAGTIDLEAGTAVVMTGRTLKATGDIHVQAGTSLALGLIQSAGNVALLAGGGITDDNDGGAVDITAAGLLVRAGAAGGVGSSSDALEISVNTFTGAAGSGGLFVLEDSDLSVDSVTVTVNRLSSTGTSSTQSSTQADLVTTAGNGAIVLASVGGSLTLNDGDANGSVVSANGSGNVLVQTLGSNKSLTVNADVLSGSGNVSLLSGYNLSLAAGADVRTSSTAAGNGSIDLEAGGTGALTMSATSVLQSTGSTAVARLQAGTNVTVGDIEVATGAVSITATDGSILDADALVSGANDADLDITAASLRLNASNAVGQSVNQLETSVGTLSVRAGAGGLFVLEADALSVGSVAVTANRVTGTASTVAMVDAAQADLVTSAGGAIVLRSTAGSLTLGDGNSDGIAVSADGTGNVLIQALGAGTDITANADILTGSGNVSVLAARSMAFTGTADIRTSSTGAGSGSIDLEAGTGSITQSATSVLLSTGATATARLLAATSVTVGDIELSTGKVSITATAGSILDADALVSGANDADQDITASALRLNAGTAIGDRVNHLETTVATLSARAAAGGIYLLEADALSVDDVGLSVNRVASDATTSTASSTDAAQSDVRSTGANGAIVLRTTAGSITLNNGTAPGTASTPTDDTAISANGTGNVLVQALGAGTDITANADILSGSGNVSVLAARSVSFTGTADIRTTSTAAGSGSIDVLAGTGSITQSATSVLLSTGATAMARLLAATDVTVGDMELSTGKVSITATAGSILDADALVSGANDADQDITASAVRLNAGTAIGDSVNHLETSVATLSARAAAGGIYLLEADALSVDDVALSVNRVASDATTSTASSTDAAQSDVRTTGANGAIVLRTTAGSITLNNGTAPADDTAVSANGTGNVLIQALGANTDITANADITSGSGNVSVLAARSIALTGTADIRTTSTAAGSGSIDLLAGTGSITQSATSVLLSTGATATARLLAATDVTVGDIELSTGKVSVTATAGSILDADALVSGANDADQDITASALRLNAGTAVGDSVNHLETTVATLSARAAAGGIYVLEADALSVDDVALSVNRVASDATTSTASSTDAAQSDVRTTGANGAIVLRTTAGSITLNNGTAPADDTAVSANGSGNVLVQALGTGTDITANADIRSTSGNLSVLAARSVSFTGTADLRTTSTAVSSGSIDVLAGTGSITQSATSLFQSTGSTATARLLAATSVTVGDISLATGAVSITATAGSILDADALVSMANDADDDITAGALRLNAGTVIGDSVNHLEIAADTLSAAAAGSVFLLEADDLTVGSVAVSVNRVGSAAAVTTVSDAAQADLRTTANGSVVLRSNSGSLTLNDGNTDGVVISANGTGQVLLQTLGAGQDITVNADILSTNGNVSVLATQSLTLTAGADVRTASTAAGNGSIDLQAGSNPGDNLTMSATSVLLSTGATATARLVAGFGSVTVGDIVLATGAVSIDAGMDILDADGVTTTNDADQDITASALRLNAGGAIGDSMNHLETTVGTLSARAAAGGIYLLEADALSVDDVAVSVNRVASDASTSTANSTDAAQSDVRTTGANGAIVLRTTAGSITLNNGSAPSDDTAVSADGTGNVLIQTLGTGTDITANADITSGSGNVSVLAARSVSFAGTADIRTSSSASGSGSIDVLAGTGSITQSAGSLLLSTGATATARLLAATNVTVGDIDLSTGRVSITATAGSILDADALVSTANDADDDITALSLRLNAGTAIGDSVNHLETTVGTLSAQAAAGGIYVLEADALTVGSVTVSVNRVGSAATTSAVSDAAQADVRTTGSNGAIVLRSTAGSLTLTDGNTDGIAVSANGTGNVLIQAQGTGSDVSLNADIVSTNGNVSVLAADDLVLAAGADVRTASSASGNGGIDLEAGTGALTMDATSVLLSTGSTATARLKAGTSVTVGDISLAAGAVSITATAGSILDADALVSAANDADDDITALSLRLNAGTAIGDSVNHLETTVGTLSAQAAGGSIYLLEADALTVGSVTVSVNRVGSAAATSAVSDAAQADVRTTGGNGAIVLRSTAGDLTLTDGNTDGVAVSADGTGNVLLQTLSAAKDVLVNADVQSASGNLSVLAGRHLSLSANADLRITAVSPGAASIDAEAGAGALTMSATSVVSSSGTGATARLKAATSVTVGDISLAAGAVSITATAGSILDADALVSTANDADDDITALSLRLNAGTAIGDSVNHLETTVGTLSAQAAAGGIYLLEADALTVGSVTVSVNRVGSTAATSAVSDAAQADVRTTGSNGAIVLRSTAGSLTLTDGNSDTVAVSANGSGNVLLQAQGTGSDLSINAGVVSGTGHVTLKAADEINVSANVKTASAGTISLQAGGALTQLGSSTIEATGSSLRLSAGQDLTLGNLVASDVSLVSASGAVISAVGSSKNVTATVLRIAADDAVGSSANNLSTSVRTVSVASTGSQSAGIFLTEDNGLTVGSVSVSVTEVTSTGAAAANATVDAAQRSLTAGGNSDMRLQLRAGDLAVADATQSLKATRLLLQVDAGSAGANTLRKETLLGSAIDSKVNAAVDTVAELQQLADAVAAVLAAVVGGPGPSVEQLQALGVTGVTPKNLAAVLKALQTTAEDGSGADSLSELQALVTQAQLVQPPVTLTQLAAIMQAADDNNATEGKPSLTDYSQAAGVGSAGVLRVTSSNIAAINSALNTAAIGRAQVDSVAKIQVLVDAYSRVLAAADALDNDTAKPSLADYTAIGITGVDSAVKVSLLGDVIDITARTNADTAAELQALADAVSALLAGVSAGNPSPSLAQLQALGLTGLNPANLAAVQLAIQNTSDDGLGADTLPELQALVTALAPAANTITGAAQANSATEANPSLATYTQAGVTGVTTANLAAINNALNSAGVDAAAVDTTAEIQALVNAYKLVLSTADGVTSATAKPTRAQYELIGLSGMSAPVVALDVGTLALRVQPSGAGSAFLSNVGALNVATVLGVAGAQVGGNWVLTSGTSADTLSIQGNVSTGGVLRLDSRGSLSVQADVQAQDGLTLVAAGAISSAAGADLLSQAGDAYLLAGTAIDLAGDVTSTLGSALVQAGTELAFETLNAISGKVVLMAGTGSIMGKTAAVDVRADVLLAQAGQGIGSVANALRVSVSDLSLSAGAGGVSLMHKDEGVRVGGVTVASLQNQSVQAVSANGSSSAVVRSQSGITVTGNGSLALSADSDVTISQAVSVGYDISLTAGSISVAAATTAGNDLSATATDIFVTASTTVGDDLSLTGDLISVAAAAVAGGDVSLRAGATLGVTALGRVQSGSTANLYMGASAGPLSLSAGSVVQAGSGGASLTASQDLNLRGELLAAGTLDALAGRDISMSTVSGVGRTQGSVTAAGNVRLEAGRALALGSVDASAAAVALKAGTTLTDGDNDDTVPQVDVRALALSVQTGTDTGTVLDRIDVAVNTLALRTTSGSAYVNESNGLSVAAFTVPLQRILADGSSQAHPGSAGVFDGLVLQGNLVLALAAGDLTLGGLGVQASGSVDLRVAGSVLEGDTSTDDVDITATSLSVTATGLGTSANKLETSLASLSGTLGTGGIFLVETDALLVSTLTSAGQVSLTTSLAGRNLSIASLSAVGQAVTLSSQGAVLDADSGSDDMDITAASLSVTATGLGTSGSKLETSLGSLSGTLGAGGVYLVEADALLVSSLVSGGAVNLTTTASGSLSIASLNASGQAVTLNIQGAVLDGDSGSDNVDITAASLSLTATGLGASANTLETALDSLSGTVGAGGLYAADAGALLVNVASSGAVSLATGGDLSIASLSAPGQSVTLSVVGSVLDGNSGSDTVKLVAGRLNLQAVGLGSQGAPLKTNLDSLVAEIGSGGIYLKEADAMEVISASGTGPLSVQSPVGAFTANQAMDLTSPLQLQSADIQIGAPLSGPQVDVLTPTVNGLALPLVLGSLVAGRTPDNGVHIDNQEASLLLFDKIVLGSNQSDQAIWFQTDTTNTADQLVFQSPVEVDTLGNTRFSGLIQGTGLKVNGPGHTTYLDGADLMQTQDVVINDRVLVTQSSIIEVVGGTLTINGGILVKAGQTLQLLADTIDFGRFTAGTPVTITLEAGATLVLGTDQLDWQGVLFDSDGGQVVLRGAPDALHTQVLTMAPDAVPKAFEPSAEDLDRWLAWLAADQDGDAGLASLTLGDAQAFTQISSSFAWTDLGAGSVVLRGSAVHLGSVGDAAWTFSDATVLRATAGSLVLNVDLKALSDVSLVSTLAQVQMSEGVTIAANGSVALSAASGISVGQIESDKRIDLYSPAGQIAAVAGVSGGAAHLSAPVVSMYGYGQSWASANAEQVLHVQTQALQVSAPSGVASRGMTADGLVYRLMDRGVGYLQLQLVGNTPERVMVAGSQVQTEVSQISGGRTPAQAWQAPGSATGLAARVPTVSVQTPAVSRYLESHQSVAPMMFMRSLNVSAPSSDLLNDMSYGLNDGQNETDDLSLEPGSPLLRSTGQLVNESDWTVLVG